MSECFIFANGLNIAKSVVGEQRVNRNRLKKGNKFVVFGAAVFIISKYQKCLYIGLFFVA